ncbi:MAG: hypothetical protein IKX97_05230 [Erysipelotrichaceae bacterium]|nr:hypothetical protein [Erysipelotrichaceae bacterium]
MRTRISTSYVQTEGTGRHLLRGLARTFLYTVSVMVTGVLAYIGFFASPETVYASTVKPAANAYEQYLAEQVLESHAANLLQVFEVDQEIMEDPRPQTVYNSDTNWYLYEGYYMLGTRAAYRTWTHAFSLYRQGLIHGSDTSYQCTFFAQMWFYDVYGFNSSGNGPTGNGDAFALKVYNSAVYYDEDGVLHHLFKLDDHPETMGIISTTYPHVICVDEVDYEAGTITVSDGNVNGSGAIRIRQTYTLDEFYASTSGRMTFCNPTEELLETLKND